jgi:hypothetical protein
MPPPILHLGPPATGKSHALHAILQNALQQQNPTVRLLVPTATLAEHLRHKFARQGFLLRKDSIQTLSHFLAPFPQALAAPTPAQLAQAIQHVLQHHCPPAFAPLQSATGFRDLLTSTLTALNLAQANEIPAPLATIYKELQSHLATQTLALRGTRLAQLQAHPTNLTHLLLDGFFAFANAELQLLQALAPQLQLELTLPPGPDAQRAIAALNPQIIEYSTPRRQASQTLLSAATREDEVLEIARQILALQAAGTPLRHCAVILRNPNAYAPLIEATFTRLAIPSRSYLSQPLSKHPLIQFTKDLIAAAQSDWEHGQILRALRWSQTGLGGTPAGDQLEFQIRESLPQSGPNSFPQLAPLAHWPTSHLSPQQWAQELSQIPHLLPPKTLEANPEAAHISHQNQAALQAFQDCLKAAATALPATPIPLATFWPTVDVGLRAATLFERDSRREVVHILDLHEARQWEVPHVFAPGLVEGEFPPTPTPDPLLSDEARRQAGMRTLADQDFEEKQLFQVLSTRATRSTTFLYPRSNAKGNPTLPSLFLTQTPKPAPQSQVETPAPNFEPQSGQLARGYRPTKAWSASEFELYLQCPFKHFAQRGLALQGLPETPPERLNTLLLGEVAHDIIATWTSRPHLDIEALTERTLQNACAKERVPPGYQYELARLNLLRHMRLYADHAPQVPPGWQTHAEESFQFTHSTGIQIRGQIDRYDLSPTGAAHAYDYKYSKSTGLSEKYVQGGLYTQALQSFPQVKQVDQFAYVALREDAKLEIMDGPRLQNILNLVNQDVEAVVQGVSEGRIPVQPKDPKLCQYCDFSDACRIATRRIADQEETYTPPESEEATASS